MREHADAAVEAGEAEPLLIVGVHHDGRTGGEGEQYGLFLTRELMPWTAARYRVLPEREATAMGGSSLGGLVTLYLGLRYAERFGKLAVLSPRVWWNNRSILGYVDSCASRIASKPRIWLDVGANEGGALPRTPRICRSGYQPAAGGAAKTSTSNASPAAHTTKPVGRAACGPCCIFYFRRGKMLANQTTEGLSPTVTRPALSVSVPCSLVPSLFRLCRPQEELTDAIAPETVH